MLVNTRRSGVVTSTSPWTYNQSLTVWTRWKSHLQRQKESYKDQERCWLPLWVSRPKQGLKNTKGQGMPSELSAGRTFLILLRILEKIEKLPYEKKRPKHEPTESYFHLSRQLAKCMMRSDTFNWYKHGGYTEITAPFSNVNVTNESKSKRIIFNKPLLQKISADENVLCSTKEDESEWANKKQNYAKNEVACDATNYFNVSNVFECGRNNTDVSCGRACMATEDN